VDFVSTRTHAAPFLMAMTVGDAVAEEAGVADSSLLPWLLPAGYLILLVGAAVLFLLRRRRKARTEAPV
jgi:hypothetical protein